MMRPSVGDGGEPSANTEQFVLLVCGSITVGLGLSPILGETNMAGQLAIWIDRAVATLRLSSARTSS